MSVEGLMQAVEKLIQEMIQKEVQRAIAPLTGAVEQLQQRAGLEQKLRALLGQPEKRGPGRPPKVAVLGRAPTRKAGRPAKAAGTTRACAIIGCSRPVRTKGYCAAHYQKLRMLKRTKRLPADWVENAQPHAVKDIVLARGRAGAKALAALKKK